jgi:hypothetical protein
MNVCRWVLDSDIRDGSDFGGGNGISHDIDFGDNNDSHKDRRGKMRSKPIYGERCLIYGERCLIYGERCLIYG